MPVKNEIWKVIDGFSNYEVSNLGRVKSTSRYKKFKGGYALLKETFMSPHPDGGGYLQVVIRTDDGVRMSRKVHRLVAIAFLENPLNLPEVDHKDFDLKNCKVDNLEWCTTLENQRRKYLAGRHPHKLSKEQVNDIIKKVRGNNENQYDVAKRFGVHQSHISKIVNNKRCTLYSENATK